MSLFKKLGLYFGGLTLVVALGTSLLFNPSKENIREIVGSNVVKLTAEPYGKGGGTGFVVKTPNGNKLTVTNKHVCDGIRFTGKGVYATTQDGKVSKLQYIQVHDQADLCILSPVAGLNGLFISNVKHLRNGQEAHVVGHPFLWGLAMTTGEVLSRELVDIAVYRDPDTKECNHGKAYYGFCMAAYWAYATTIKAAPGNSGSPVVDNSGKLIGVLFAGNDLGYSFIVPVEFLKELISGY